MLSYSSEDWNLRKKGSMNEYILLHSPSIQHVFWLEEWKEILIFAIVSDNRAGNWLPYKERKAK